MPRLKYLLQVLGTVQQSTQTESSVPQLAPVITPASQATQLSGGQTNTATSTPPTKSKKKGNQRSIVPKPSATGETRKSTANSKKKSIKSAKVVEMAQPDSVSDSLQIQIPESTTEPDTSTHTTEASPSSTDILAKAAESIFSTSMSELTTPVGGFYNPANEDNPLHIDTSATEGGEEEGNKSPVKIPNSENKNVVASKTSDNVKKITPVSVELKSSVNASFVTEADVTSLSATLEDIADMKFSEAQADFEINSNRIRETEPVVTVALNSENKDGKADKNSSIDLNNSKANTKEKSVEKDKDSIKQISHSKKVGQKKDKNAEMMEPFDDTLHVLHIPEAVSFSEDLNEVLDQVEHFGSANVDSPSRVSKKSKSKRSKPTDPGMEPSTKKRKANQKDKPPVASEALLSMPTVLSVYDFDGTDDIVPQLLPLNAKEFTTVPPEQNSSSKPVDQTLQDDITNSNSKSLSNTKPNKNSAQTKTVKPPGNQSKNSKSARATKEAPIPVTQQTAGQQLFYLPETFPVDKASSDAYNKPPPNEKQAKKEPTLPDKEPLPSMPDIDTTTSLFGFPIVKIPQNVAQMISPSKMSPKLTEQSLPEPVPPTSKENIKLSPVLSNLDIQVSPKSLPQIPPVMGNNLPSSQITKTVPLSVSNSQRPVVSFNSALSSTTIHGKDSVVSNNTNISDSVNMKLVQKPSQSVITAVSTAAKMVDVVASFGNGKDNSSRGENDVIKKQSSLTGKETEKQDNHIFTSSSYQESLTKNVPELNTSSKTEKDTRGSWSSRESLFPGFSNHYGPQNMNTNNSIETSKPILTNMSETPKTMTTNISEPPKALTTSISEPPKALTTSISEPPKALTTNISEPPKVLSTNISEPPKALTTSISEPPKVLTTNISEPPKGMASNISEPQKALTTNISEPPKPLTTNISEAPKSLTTNISEPPKAMTTNINETSKTLTSNSSDMNDSLNAKLNSSDDYTEMSFGEIVGPPNPQNLGSKINVEPGNANYPSPYSSEPVFNSPNKSSGSIVKSPPNVTVSLNGKISHKSDNVSVAKGRNNIYSADNFVHSGRDNGLRPKNAALPNPGDSLLSGSEMGSGTFPRLQNEGSSDGFSFANIGLNIAPITTTAPSSSYMDLTLPANSTVTSSTAPPSSSFSFSLSSSSGAVTTTTSSVLGQHQFPFYPPMLSSSASAPPDSEPAQAHQSMANTNMFNSNNVMQRNNAMQRRDNNRIRGENTSLQRGDTGSIPRGTSDMSSGNIPRGGSDMSGNIPRGGSDMSRNDNLQMNRNTSTNMQRVESMGQREDNPQGPGNDNMNARRMEDPNKPSCSKQAKLSKGQNNNPPDLYPFPTPSNPGSHEQGYFRNPHMKSNMGKSPEQMHKPDKVMSEMVPPQSRPSNPQDKRSGPLDRSPQLMNQGQPYFPPQNYPPAKSLNTPPLHHPPMMEDRSRNMTNRSPYESSGPPASQGFNNLPHNYPVNRFDGGPPGFSRDNSGTQPLSHTPINSGGRKSANPPQQKQPAPPLVSMPPQSRPAPPQPSHRPTPPLVAPPQAPTPSQVSNASRPKQTASRSSKSKKAKQHPFVEVDSNLSNSIFEPNRSMTPFFPVQNLSPQSRAMQHDGSPFLPGNFFGPGPRLNSNTPLPKNSDIGSPFNPLFQPGRAQNGLGLNFQPGFGMNMNALHGNHGNGPQITPHTGVASHMPNFNLNNIFSDVNSSQSESLNISPIKFGHANSVLQHQSGMDPGGMQHHHQNYRGHPPPPPSVLSMNSILGPNHHGFDGRSLSQMNTSMAPPFHSHGHPPFIPPLNFSMHDH